MRIAVANAYICLSRGGAERAAIRLATELLNRGHDVHLLTVKAGLPPLYDITPVLPVHFLPESFFCAKQDAVESGIQILSHLKYDALISFESDMNHEIWGRMCRQARVPQIASERITPWVTENISWNAPARRQFLHACAGIHELLPGYVRFIPESDRGKAFVIPNVAPDFIADDFPWRSNAKKEVLFLGRLCRQKRPELLLEAFAFLAGDFPDWSLRFAGWGDKEDELQARALELGIASRVYVGPAYPDVSLDYQNAAIYCLPTRHEGFPNAVLEAWACGLPVVGIGDCEAMASIIQPGINGLLAPKPTPEALAVALRPLMTSDSARERMGRNGWKICHEEYAPRRIFDAWEDNLERIVCKEAHSA